MIITNYWYTYFIACTWLGPGKGRMQGLEKIVPVNKPSIEKNLITMVSYNVTEKVEKSKFRPFA